MRELKYSTKRLAHGHREFTVFEDHNGEEMFRVRDRGLAHQIDHHDLVSIFQAGYMAGCAGRYERD